MRGRAPTLAACAALLALARTAALHAQQPGPAPVCAVDSEAPIRRMRAGLGAAVGSWRVRDLVAPSGGTASESPAVEAYFARGLDLHLALEQSIVFWRRGERAAGGGEVTSYLLGQFTSLRAYPLTRPTARLEPWLRGGAGFTLGIEDRGDVPDPRTGETGTRFAPGLGLLGRARVAREPRVRARRGRRLPMVPLFQRRGGRPARVSGGRLHRRRELPLPVPLSATRAQPARNPRAGPVQRVSRSRSSGWRCSQAFT
jgi:hypothetical protein